MDYYFLFKLVFDEDVMARFTNRARIYWFIGFILILQAGLCSQLLGQIAHEIGDYKTVVGGNYDNPAIWQRWNGTNWIAAVEKPGVENNIFINHGNEVRLRANEAAKHVYLNAEGEGGRKLNLQSFELQVYGSLRLTERDGNSFKIVAFSPAMTLIDWIYPETGKLVFKGFSRNVVDRNSWSAQNTRSRFTVVFDPEPAQTLTVNAAFKASKFIIQSGTVFQTLNLAGVAACSIFSYNTQAAFNGTNPYGDFIIENGGRLITECGGAEPIIWRSNAMSGKLFHLKPGADLLIRTNASKMEVENILLQGNVYYSSVAGTQQFLRTTFADAKNPESYHNILFENGAIKQLPAQLTLTGDLVRFNGGNVVSQNTTLALKNLGANQIAGFNAEFLDVEMDKTAGSVQLSGDLRVRRNLVMKTGKFIFDDFDLYINTLGTGLLTYEGGEWLTLHRLFYNNLPAVLNPANATFPFEDRFQGGVRSLQLRGNSNGGNLRLQFIEIPGADWDPDFDDSDGTPILYQLNSFFNLDGLSIGTETIELRISAENLEVDNVDDLRIVGNGEAAPGTNLPGQNPVLLWARRSIPLNDINNQSYTIGSYRVLSVLPVEWLEVGARWVYDTPVVFWSTAKEWNNEKFILYRSIGGINDFVEVDEIESQGDSDAIQAYLLEDKMADLASDRYYQIEQVDNDGNSTKSKVFRLEALHRSKDFNVFPNPYQSGPIFLQIPDSIDPNEVIFSLVDLQGNKLIEMNYSQVEFESALEKFPVGLFILQIRAVDVFHQIRIIKH